MACGGIGDFWTCNAVEKENNTTHIPCIIIYIIINVIVYA